MPRTPALLRTLPFVAVIALAACQPTPDKTDNAPTGIAAKAMDEARKGLGEASQELQKAQSEIDAARKKLATENLTLNRNENQHLPNAEITPAGDLVIDGTSVKTTPEQKEKVLAYRGAMITVAGDGMAIGMEGAKVGIDAAASALQGVLAGQSGDEIGKQVGAEAKTKLKPMVDQLCSRLPALLTAQQALAASVPEFKPYASLDQTDVDDCASQSDWNF